MVKRPKNCVCACVCVVRTFMATIDAPFIATMDTTVMVTTDADFNFKVDVRVSACRRCVAHRHRHDDHRRVFKSIACTMDSVDD